VWDDLIAWKDQQHSWLEDLVRAKVSCDDQGGLNFCHAASTIQAARDRYALMGETVPDLAGIRRVNDLPAELPDAAVMDWFTRRVVAWRVSITLEADFCIEAVQEALARHGPPEISGCHLPNFR
jgi:transposase InsO family protein